MVDPITAPICQAERFVAERQYAQALGQIGFAPIPADPDHSYVVRVLACDAAARKGLEAQRLLRAA
jgi:hypothetical protein